METAVTGAAERAPASLLLAKSRSKNQRQELWMEAGVVKCR